MGELVAVVLRDLVAVTTSVTGSTVDSVVGLGFRVTTLVSTSVVIAGDGARNIELTSIFADYLSVLPARLDCVIV